VERRGTNNLFAETWEILAIFIHLKTIDMKNLKVLMMVVVLMMALGGSVVAQDKYDFAMVTLPASGNHIHILTSNEAERLAELDRKLDAFQRLKVALIEVSKMTDQGWEVINVSQDLYNMVYHFKKKKA
jgi:hypothetical protein